MYKTFSCRTGATHTTTQAHTHCHKTGTRLIYFDLRAEQDSL